jgi:SAM-dependent methyltransferase
MHSLLARIPLIRRPFYQLELARQERNRALLERDSAIKERDELKLKLQDAASPGGSNPSNYLAKSEPSSRRSCVFCHKEVEAWLPFRIRASDISAFLNRVEVVGSNVERFLCPFCSSSDRERHLRLFLERLRLMEPIRGGSVLHMAPEVRLPEYIESYNLSPYVRGDLSPSDDSTQRIDLHQIPFSNETFDLVICNHVLEHVEDPAAALVEMRRVLKPGGRAICQTPFARRLTNTLEDPQLQSADDRLFFYGQEDHLRLFGSDIEQLFRGAGFTGRLVPHPEILPDVDPELLGVNEKEPFFDFVRDPAVP